MPRKTRGARGGDRGNRAASMRPRPDAAENLRHRRGHSVVADASMRPRPDAAENDGDGFKLDLEPPLQ